MPDQTKTTQAVSPANCVDLTGREIVARGNRRDVYLVDPPALGLPAAEKPLVLKIPRYKERLAHPHLAKRLVAKLFPSSLERVIRVEARYWEKLAFRYGQDPASMPLPLFHGYVNTNEGPATLWESVWGANGDLAPTIDDLAKEGDLPSAIAPLNKFVAFCFAANIVAPDIRSGNIVLAQRAGRPEAVLIDGFGDMRLFSIRTLSTRRNTEFMTKRFARMAWKSGLVFDEKRREFSMPAQQTSDGAP